MRAVVIPQSNRDTTHRNIARAPDEPFSISLGTRIPRTVELHPIPAEIVEIRPAWRGYCVIVVGSQLVIVHPTTYEIVAVVVV